MVRHMYLQQLYLRIYFLHQSTPLHHLMDCSYTPTIDRLTLLCQFVLDVSTLKHRTFLIFPLLPLQPSINFLFTPPQYSGMFIPVVCAHLECPFLWLLWFLTTFILTSRSDISSLFPSLAFVFTLVQGLVLMQR